MKFHILDKDGNKIKEITTELFNEPIREDIIRKVVEAERFWQPYSPKYLAGMNRSASGKVRHKRHAWKSDRGKGLSRIPKKQMWRRGTQFSWEGAIIPSVRGGRRAHPPHGQINNKKINKKEFSKALLSSLHYVSSLSHLQKKYTTLHGQTLSLSLPLIFDSHILSLKTKDFLHKLTHSFPSVAHVAIQKKNLRAGRGKSRGRKYKNSAGMLFVVGKDEYKTIQGVDIVSAQNVTVSDLAANGARLTAFTEAAIKELENLYLKNKKMTTAISVKEKKK